MSHQKTSQRNELANAERRKKTHEMEDNTEHRKEEYTDNCKMGKRKKKPFFKVIQMANRHTKRSLRSLVARSTY